MLRTEVTTRSKASKKLHSKSSLQDLGAIVSIGNPPGFEVTGFGSDKRPSNFLRVAVPKIRLEFVDTSDPKEVGGPTKEVVERLVNFAKRLKPDMPGRVLVHCFAGHSRSTAAAFIAQCVVLGPGKEENAMKQALLGCTEKNVHPNRLMIELADKLLERNGAMLHTYFEFFSSSGG